MSQSLSMAPAPGTKWLLNKYLQRKGCEVAVGTPRRPGGSTHIKPLLFRCIKLRVSKPLKQGGWRISIAMTQVSCHLGSECTISLRDMVMLSSIVFPYGKPEIHIPHELDQVHRTKSNSEQIFCGPNVLSD